MAAGGWLPCTTLDHSCNPPDCVFHKHFSEPDIVACVRPVCEFVFGHSVEAMKSVLGSVHVQGYRDWLLLRREEADMYKASRIDGPMGVIRELQEENERLKKKIQMHLAFRDRIDSLRKGRYTESPLPKSKKDRCKKKGSTGASAGTGTSASASDGRNSGESDADDDDNQSNAVENLGNYSSIGLQQQINELPINDPEASPSHPTNEIAGDASRSPSPFHPTVDASRSHLSTHEIAVDSSRSQPSTHDITGDTSRSPSHPTVDASRSHLSTHEIARDSSRSQPTTHDIAGDTSRSPSHPTVDASRSHLSIHEIAISSVSAYYS